MRRQSIAVAITLCLGSLCVQAADFYIDPEQGSREGDGSAVHPWRSLQTVIDKGLIQTRTWSQLPYKAGCVLVPRNAGAPIKGGDTIWLRSGYYGHVLIDRHYNTEAITLAAEPNHTPCFAGLHIRSSSNWIVKGLTVSAEFADTYKRQTLVQLRSHSWHGPIHDVTVTDCAVSSVADCVSWTTEDWNALACNGFQVDGTRMTICNNYVLNVNFGISVDASHSLIQNNVVENFSGDGLRGLGNCTTFQYNTVKNCYDVNANHDDGFQSWSVGPNGVGSGEVKGIVLRGNTIINNEDPNQPFCGTLQGIGCFDGTFVDWVVENNVVIVDHWHGITLLGARHCRIINNTVMDSKPGTPGPPWIKIDTHKDGTLPEDCVVANNLGVVSSARGVLQKNNMKIQNPFALFVAPDQFDFHLLPTASAIDAGTSEDAPELDLDHVKRPQGSGVDLGAYEWHAE